MELVRIFKEHNVFGWVSVGTAILSLFVLNLAILSDTIAYSYKMLPFAMAAVPLGIIELFIKRTDRSRISRCRPEHFHSRLRMDHRLHRYESAARLLINPRLYRGFFISAPCEIDSSLFILHFIFVKR